MDNKEPTVEPVLAFTESAAKEIYHLAQQIREPQIVWTGNYPRDAKSALQKCMECAEKIINIFLEHGYFRDYSLNRIYPIDQPDTSVEAPPNITQIDD